MARWKKRRDEADQALNADLPSRQDFVAYGGLDEIWAYKNFGGLSLDAAAEKVANRFIHCIEDFVFMGIPAFCFYLPALARYFDRHEYDTEQVSTFCMICDSRITDFEGNPDYHGCVQIVLNEIDRVAQILASDTQSLLAGGKEFEPGIAYARDGLTAVRNRYAELLANM